MKFYILFLSIIGTLAVQAQEFKPYKIESGKITYETLRYSTVSGYSNKNGVETSYSKQVPYVAEQVIYYWDEFGDIAFEEIYQVSKFGGELLPEKVKIAERLWIGEHRYYFNFEENKVSDDPYHLRIKCREHFQYYQVIGSWIETQYMGTETNETKEILGLESDYYRIDNYQDLYAWKGLVLKDESFSTSGLNGPRFNIERAKLAVEIDTISKIDQELFDPVWLKREQLYQSIDEAKINEITDGRHDLYVQADNEKGIQLQKNDILLFVTAKLNLGKMQVLNIDENQQLSIRYSIYDYGKEIVLRQDFKVENNSLVNLDNSNAECTDLKQSGFEWKVTKKANLFPSNNLTVALLKTSRTNTLKFKPFVRK